MFMIITSMFMIITDIFNIIITSIFSSTTSIHFSENYIVKPLKSVIYGFYRKQSIIIIIIHYIIPIYNFVLLLLIAFTYYLVFITFISSIAFAY